jgi:hypothetical protein
MGGMVALPLTLPPFALSEVELHAANIIARSRCFDFAQPERGSC